MSMIIMMVRSCYKGDRAAVVVQDKELSRLSRDRHLRDALLHGLRRLDEPSHLADGYCLAWK
jgi:hypothetical protein